MCSRRAAPEAQQPGVCQSPKFNSFCRKDPALMHQTASPPEIHACLLPQQRVHPGPDLEPEGHLCRGGGLPREGREEGASSAVAGHLLGRLLAVASLAWGWGCAGQVQTLGRTAFAGGPQGTAGRGCPQAFWRSAGSPPRAPPCHPAGPSPLTARRAGPLLHLLLRVLGLPASHTHPVVFLPRPRTECGGEGAA